MLKPFLFPLWGEIFPRLPFLSPQIKCGSYSGRTVIGVSNCSEIPDWDVLGQGRVYPWLRWENRMPGRQQKGSPGQWTGWERAQQWDHTQGWWHTRSSSPMTRAPRGNSTMRRATILVASACLRASGSAYMTEARHPWGCSLLRLGLWLSW